MDPFNGPVTVRYVEVSLYKGFVIMPERLTNVYRLKNLSKCILYGVTLCVEY